jgi:hypothetical protein
MPTKRLIASALQHHMGEAIRRCGDILRGGDDGWPIPLNYTLRLVVAWPNPAKLGDVELRANIDDCPVAVPVRIDQGATEILAAYMELARHTWAKYVMVQHPDFCERLRTPQERR